MLNKPLIRSLLFATTLLSVCGTAQALLYDQNINPDVIFGSGNANGSWTVDTVADVELGLRAKLRFDENGNPQNVFNSNGDGTYTFAAGAAVGSWATATTPIWNFEWSINTRVDNTFQPNLNDFTYRIDIDFDPSAGTSFLSFDPINQVWADHALGNNSTPNGGGVTAVDAADYASKINTLNVAQNSWNMEFFDTPRTPNTFDPNVAGTYTFALTALNNGTDVVAQSQIDVIVVSVPDGGSTLVLLGLAMGGLAYIAKRRKA